MKLVSLSHRKQLSKTEINKVDTMKAQMIEVNVDFVIDALEMRYNDVKDQWGCEASHDLWQQALDLVRECGFSCSSASEYVDNYLINGEFVSRSEFYISDCASYGIELDCDQVTIEGGSYVELTHEQWEQVTQDALIYNDEHACLQF